MSIPYFRFIHLSDFNVFPDVVCVSLVSGGEQQDEESVNGQRRQAALMMLCDMCPSYALSVRSLCVSMLISTFVT